MSSLSRSIRRQAPAAEAQRQQVKHYTKNARKRYARRQAALDEIRKRSAPLFTPEQIQTGQEQLERIREAQKGY